MKILTALFGAIIVAGNPLIALAANETATSPDGSLTMTHNHQSGCKTGVINGVYSTPIGVAGVLYEVDCDSEGDAAMFFFMDTKGSQRCYGKMIEAWGGREGTSTTWTVKGNVPGYQCNSVGKTFRKSGMR